MMKIVMIVIDSVWHDPRVKRTAISVMDNGFDVTVLGCHDYVFDRLKIEELPFKTYIWQPKEKWNFLKHIPLVHKLYTIIASNYALIKKCNQIKPDIIHANDLNALPIAYFSAKKTKSKIVYDSHEIFTENIGIADRKLIKKFYKTIESYLVPKVHKIVMVSTSSAKIFSKMYNIPEPMVVMNCANKIDTSKLKEKNKQAFEILYQGKFYNGRGYEDFVKTAALFSSSEGIQFVLRGYGSIESSLRNLATSLDTGDVLRFDPPVNVSDITIEASSSHVGIILTESININFINTLSNKLFEYLNAGLPVILTNIPEHKLLNDKYKFGILIDNISPENIARAVRLLHNDKTLYESLKFNAIETSKILNWENEVNKLILIYKGLLGKSKEKL